jgi:hypothetical protein
MNHRLMISMALFLSDIEMRIIKINATLPLLASPFQFEYEFEIIF